MAQVRRLALYVTVGFTLEEGLAAATVVPVKNAGANTTTGPTEVGNVADLVLVEGHPSRHIRDLRNTRTVMMGGK